MVDWGGKAYGLNTLKRHGFNVPAFIVLPINASIDEIQAEAKAHLDASDLFVVRSSAAQEDSAEASHAGQFHSEVAVPYHALASAWSKVVESMPNAANDEVIIQSFIAGSFSGVSFVDAAAKRQMLDYLPGLCAAVVGGYDVHHHVFKGRLCIDEMICEHPKVMVYKDGALQEQTDQSRLSTIQLDKLVQACYMLSDTIGCPLDIEWTLKDDRLYFLQARPITRAFWSDTQVHFYDSANVGESYGGIVLPLTISFAQKLYSQVYQDLLYHSGVPRHYLARHSDCFEHLVDGAFGRMYYRMEHWYTFLSMLPGYRRNKENLEHMLMLQRNDGATVKSKRPLWYVRLAYYPRVIWKLIFFRRSMKNLEEKTRAVLQRTGQFDYQFMLASDARTELEALFAGILRLWYLTVENDTVVLSLFAALTKMKEASPEDPMLQFHSVSTEQVEHLIELSKLFNASSKCKLAIEQQDGQALMQVIAADAELKGAYDAYFSRFGGRFANELKLETPGLKEEPEAFVRLIRLYAEKSHVKMNKLRDEAPQGFFVRVFKRFASRREVFRLYRAELFSVVRRLVVVIAEDAVCKGILKSKEDAFYLNWDELMDLEVRPRLSEEINQRRAAYASYEAVEPPPHFKVINGRWPQLRAKSGLPKPLQGMSACKGKVTGKALVLPVFDVPEKLDFDVLVTKRTDPGWTPLMALSKGLVVEHGGMLSHASIVARELGIPTIIGVENACQQINSGDVITVDGDSGNILITKVSEG